MTVSAGTRTIYLDASNWNSSGAAFAIHVWGGASSQSYAFSNVSGDIYSADIADDATNAIFLRCNAEGFNLSNVWNYEWNRSTTVLSEKDQYTVNGWSSGSSDGSDYGTWSVYSGGSSEPEPSFTFTSGTTIYYDFTAYGAGVNLFNSLWNNEWKSDVSSIISCTLTSNWEVTASSSLFKSKASSWNIVTCSTLPTEGQNMLVSTDGINYTWGTYPPVVPSVSFSGVPSDVYFGQEVTFAANSQNVENPTYTYYVKQGAGEYGDAVSSYTFNAAGSYTVKVEVRENGAGDALASAEKNITCVKYSLMQNNHSDNDKGSEVAVCSTSNGSVFTATWTCPSVGTYYFYVTTNISSDAHENCDYLNAGQTFEDGVAKTAWLYGNASGCYGHSYTLNAPRAGVYTFTLTLGEGNTFKCDYPEALDAEVYLNTLPAFAYVDASLTLATYVSSVNVVQPAYTFYVKKGDAAYGDAVTSYTFDATGAYTVKAEVREQGAGGDALASVEKVINIYEPLTLYFVNKDDAWSNIHAYAYLNADNSIKNADWTGETMTKIGESNHGHDVYSITIPAGRYDIIIFNNNNSGDGNQTANLVINAATPYYFYGAWYATLAEADPADTYTLVGEVPGLSWVTTDVNFDMTEDNGVYTFLMENVELAVNNYAYKIVKNHSYDVAYPQSGNASLEIATAGIYNLTFTLDLSASPEYSVTPDLIEETVVVPTIKISSNIKNPDWEESAEFVSTDGNITASLVLTDVAAGHYEFGVLIAGAWTKNGAAFTRANASHAITSGEDNLTFYADQAGDYTFTWTFASNTLEITYPTLVKKTIYISNLTGWEEVALYAYDTNDAPIIGNWPGAVSSETEVVETVTYIKYEIPESLFPCTIIFNNNNNGQQTADYNLATAQNYYLVAEQGILHDKDLVLETYHLYVRNLTTWNEFDVYAWGDKYYFGAWGGKTSPDNTTQIDGITYNVYDFQAFEGSTINMNIIFHNEISQLADYPVTEAKDYYFTVTNDVTYEGLSGVKRFRACETLEHVYGYQYPDGADWPGVELTPNAEGWYEYIVTKGHTVIFNNGTGEGAMQTGDLAYTNEDPVADECAVWQGETNVSDKTYMVTSDECDAPCLLTYERNVTAGNYGTIILPYEAATVTGATLFSIAGKNDDGIFIDEENSLLKGVPYIFLASADKIIVRYWDGQSFTPSMDNLYTTNGLVGFIGENESDLYSVTKDAHNFILYNNGLYYVNSDNVKVASNRAFIDWSNVPDNTPAPAPGRKRCSIGVHSMPTAIDQIADETHANKVIENGQLFIIMNGVKYNAQGIIVK